MMDDSPTSALPPRNVNGVGLNGSGGTPAPVVPQVMVSAEDPVASGGRDTGAPAATEADPSQVGI